MTSDPVRVALVTNVLSHYRVPCFEALATHLDAQLTVFLLSEGMGHRRYVEANRKSEIPVVPLPGIHFHRPPNDDRHLNDPRPILRGNFDVVILSAWDEPTYLLLWAWCLVRRKRCIFWIESTPSESVTTGLRGFIKRLLLRKSQGCMVPGKRAAALCHQLGVPKDRIFVAPNAADRRFFRSQAATLMPQREEIRAEMNLGQASILFVGRLVEEIKSVSTLIDACAVLQSHGTRVSLLMAGDGPDRRAYEERARQRGLADARFLGILDHGSLCRLYAAATVLVLPSRSETWGFVLNEAMEFGLPLVVSDAVGAGPDLVRSQVNGLTVPVGDVNALAEALSRLVSDPRLSARLAAGSRRVISEFTPEKWAEGALRAIGGCP